MGQAARADDRRFPLHLLDHPAHNPAPEILSLCGDRIERGGRTKIDHDRGAAVRLIGRDRIHDAIRPHLARIVVEDGHPGPDPGSHHDRTHAEVGAGQLFKDGLERRGPHSGGYPAQRGGGGFPPPAGCSAGPYRSSRSTPRCLASFSEASPNSRWVSRSLATTSAGARARKSLLLSLRFTRSSSCATFWSSRSTRCASAAISISPSRGM